MLAPGLLLLEGGGPRLDQRILDAASNLGGEHRPCIQRPRHRLLPGLQHFVEFAACLRIDQRVCIHKGLVHVLTQEPSVGGSYVLDNGVDYIQSRQLLRRRSLHTQIRRRSHKSLQRGSPSNDGCLDASKVATYCSDMILQHATDCHGMFGVLFGDDGQIADLEPVVGR